MPGPSFNPTLSRAPYQPNWVLVDGIQKVYFSNPRASVTRDELKSMIHGTSKKIKNLQDNIFRNIPEIQRLERDLKFFKLTWHQFPNADSDTDSDYETDSGSESDSEDVCVSDILKNERHLLVGENSWFKVYRICSGEFAGSLHCVDK